MQPQQLINLLALLPEDKHAEFLSLLPKDVARAIADEQARLDEQALQSIAEAVWSCLES